MDYFEIFAAAIGLGYIYFEYKGRWPMWVLGVVMPLCYVWIYFRSGLYANATLNVYNVVISIYGLHRWLHGGADGGEAPIVSMPRRYTPWVIGAIMVMAAGLTWLLSLLGESQAIWGVGSDGFHIQACLDGLTASLSVVGMWMLARKYYQQWLCWILVEPLTVLMCVATHLWATAVLYGVYMVVAVMGYVKWKRQAMPEDNKKEK